MATKIFRSTKYRFLAIGLSAAFLLAGVIALIVTGFNLGIDFQSGFSQKFQIAPAALSLSYQGADTVTVGVVEGDVSLTVRSAETGIKYHEFSSATYRTIGELAQAISSQISGVTVEALLSNAPTASIITGFGLPATLGETAFVLNGENTDRAAFVTIDQVRQALEVSAQVQTVGSDYQQVFQIRLGSDSAMTQEELSADVLGKLQNAFGKDKIVILQSDFIGPKFSATLVLGSILAVLVAVVLILVYVWFRFKISYALAAIINLVHDTFALVAFIILFQLEVSSTTIAALLTIIGYSLNNVIVIFDRIRENRKIVKDMDLLSLIDTSVSQSLSRTILSSLTTILAILPLAILASGAIQLFAIEMVFGVAIGAYSSNMIAPTLFFWITKKKGLPQAKAISDDATEAESIEDEQVADIEIPKFERKLKGKRQDKK